MPGYEINHKLFVIVLFVIVPMCVVCVWSWFVNTVICVLFNLEVISQGKRESLLFYFTSVLVAMLVYVCILTVFLVVLFVVSECRNFW